MKCKCMDIKRHTGIRTINSYTAAFFMSFLNGIFHIFHKIVSVILTSMPAKKELQCAADSTYESSHLGNKSRDRMDPLSSGGYYSSDFN